jgi:small-conductance mechanosensitive channel
MSDLAKCFTFFTSLSFVYVIALFAMAYIIYLALLFASRKLKRRGGIGAKLSEELRYPVLFLLFEIAAALSIQLLPLPDFVTKKAVHVVNILIIATIGWLVIGITRSFYRVFIEKTALGKSLDMSRRTLLTQVLFLYRFGIFAILAVTAATILLTFPYIKTVGLGILGSAGIMGIVLGIAAKPILLNLMVGFQIAFTKMIKIGDAIYVENEFARIESIHLTRVVLCTWDLRRIIIPISYFIDKPFQNWDLNNPELLSYVYLYCDYTVPVDAIRKKAEELIKNNPNWNGKVWNVQVTDVTEQTIQVRVLASANDASTSNDLRASLRENLIEFLQKEYPQTLPRVRNYQITDKKS